jgi:ribosomal protein L11 methyltransferase
MSSLSAEISSSSPSSLIWSLWLVYATCLNANGFLFLSGFYKEDIPKIQAVCKHCNLSFEAQIFRNDWVALKFKNQ